MELDVTGGTSVEGRKRDARNATKPKWERVVGERGGNGRAGSGDWRVPSGAEDGGMAALRLKSRGKPTNK